MPATKAAARQKTERIEVRVSPRTKALLLQAANSSHKNVTDFLLDAGVSAAETALIDRRLFRLDDRAWNAFEKILDRKPAKKPRLAKLMARRSVLE